MPAAVTKYKYTHLCLLFNEYLGEMGSLWVILHVMICHSYEENGECFSIVSLLNKTPIDFCTDY